MATNPNSVLAGVPDQLTTGAIWAGPAKGFAIPADPFIVTKPVGFTDSGYVSEDGLALSIDRSLKDIKDWSGAIVRRLLEEFSGSMKYAHLELNKFALEQTFGAANVTQHKAPSVTTGTQSKIAVNADNLPRQAMYFRMKDGKARVVVIIPDGQVTEVGEVSFKASEAITMENTVSCYPDALGNSIYIFLDDGIFTA